MALGQNCFSRLLLWLNLQEIKVSRGLFSWQIFMVSKTLPSLAYLLALSIEQSEIRARL